MADDQSIHSNSLSIDTNFTLPDSLPDDPVTRMHDVITLLFELDASLADPTPQDRFDRAHPSAAQQDINHVRAKFSQASDELVERLGRANWDRRQYLRRLQLEFEGSRPVSFDGMDYSPEDVEESDAASESSSSEESVTEAGSGSYPDSLEDNIERGGAPSIRSSQDLTVTASAQTEFQFSHEETQSTRTTEPSKGPLPAEHAVQPVNIRYRIPPPPHPNEDLSGKAFRCTFCSHTVPDITRHSDWTFVVPRCPTRRILLT
jgi:hypothetical protein